MVQSFTAHMPSVMATSTFSMGQDAKVLLNSVIYTVSIPKNNCVRTNTLIVKQNNIMWIML